ncbi:nitrite/sulfite reductase domain-containing protein [Anaeromicrobium sediminis]|uniref:Nitrite reductase n=1 Tax=Anaeromicrobium sediminis TaxID=1478221 RepID=A0A267MBS4_9FIRM|nr:NAD(P)/FAD-dependent oxidoreductase [Anaeromicrobium sediminis]PAB56907.1 nitrite reductase [Anaeromicrobium sediminis]
MNPKYAVLQKIKNGKRVYAITPRIPGGFISANQMIKIAEVAKKYKASIKFTSGQRVSLIGLKAEDVEKAWEDLGMDPGVLSAYSVKNVEICPGEICKRARQKSLGLGMRLERRFYGAPAPNRTKIGVVACLNGCTSLHAKDIGVLANEEGFIVVAGGSAGFHQRLSDEIKRNLTEEEAFILVESLFDYYCENAEAGEKLGHFMDRIGVDKFREEVLKVFEERMKGSDNIE